MSKKKAVIFFSIGVGIGFCVGYAVGHSVSRKETGKDAVILPDTSDDDPPITEEKPVEPVLKEDVPDPDDEEEEELSDEDEILVAMGEATEEYRTKHKGEIELIGEKEYRDDEIYDTKMPVYFFPDEGILADEIGNELDLYSYVGSWFERMNFYTSEDEFLYIRNNPKELDIKVQKITDVPYSIMYGI